MAQATWRERLQYRFDGVMARGPLALIGLLFLIALAIITVAGLVLVIARLAGGAGVGASVWTALMHLIDPGTITGDVAGAGFLGLMLVVTIIGIVLLSVLIGIISQGLSDKAETLRKGHSRVLESGHTIVLGFNEATFTVLAELCEAHANAGGGVVVVLDAEPKEAMDEAIRTRLPDTRGTRIITRSGRIDSFADLTTCGLAAARSVIVQADDDAHAVKAILAATSLLDDAGNTDTYLTAVIRDEGSYHAAQVAGGARAQILYLGSTLGRIMAHACRQPGISGVFTEVFAYGGNEVYVEAIAGVAGHLFGDLNLVFPHSVVLGFVRGGQTRLDPPAGTAIEAGDRLIVLAPDDSVSHPEAAPHPVDESAFAPAGQEAPTPQHLLVLGANPLLADVLLELDRYLPAGSTVTVAADAVGLAGLPRLATLPLAHLALVTRPGDIHDRATLADLIALGPGSVLVLTDDHEDDADADAHVLQVLLLLRAVAQASGAHFDVTSEMRSVESQELARVTKVTDFVVSSNLTALIMTQISQTRELGAIFEDLLDESGAELYSKPAGRYVKLGRPVDGYTAHAAAARRDEVLLGYRQGGVLTLNPAKDGTATFGPGDTFIVIAQG
jgi:Trk K+ transport system NAD-binding subunit